MRKTKDLLEIYSSGQNVSSHLRNEMNVAHNTQEIIEKSYDLQSGSYISGMKSEAYSNNRKLHSFEIVKTIQSLCEPESILEAGVGEATIFSEVLQQLDENVKAYGFDISWSRLACARDWLNSNGGVAAEFCTGDLLNIPFLENSIDVVYTSNSIEPNGGYERPILKELHRVARRFLILVEPDYEIASQDSKAYMDSHGYCKKLKSEAETLGFNIIMHEPFPINSNPLNPLSITVIAKTSDNKPTESVYACPKYKTPLIKRAEAYYSDEALVAYPILGGIPCLRIENGIFASKYLEKVNI